ncbi:MAG: hypothetical protein II859_07500 [Bacteroidales bacterium]|nr:hypothetical protein [Bacteroidales bacterium]
MSKKKLVFSDEAIELLNSPEGRQILMGFFGIKDKRTVENYLANNVPSNFLLNMNIGEEIRKHLPNMTDKRLFRKETREEERSRNIAYVEKILNRNRNEKNGDHH